MCLSARLPDVTPHVRPKAADRVSFIHLRRYAFAMSVGVARLIPTGSCFRPREGQFEMTTLAHSISFLFRSSTFLPGVGYVSLNLCPAAGDDEGGPAKKSF